MKLELRDLKQVRWDLEVDEKDTVAQVKARNAEARSFGDDVVQKLIYSGRILKDADTIGSYNIEEGKQFIVCMTSKKKPSKSASRAPEPEAAAAPQTAPQPGSTTASAGSTPGPQPERPTATSFSDPNSLATGAQLEGVVANIVDMGYERPLVMTALRMAYNNPDRAVEYLITGQAEQRHQQLSAEPEPEPRDSSPPQADAAPDSDAPGPNSDGGDNDTTDVNLIDSAAPASDDIHDPQDIRQLRDLVRQNPSLLEPLLQELAARNPMLADAMSQNFEELLESGGDADLDEPIPEGGVPPGSTTLEITPEENEAITRLMELGFDRTLVIQAYFACDKNEEIAANFLFEHGNEE